MRVRPSSLESEKKKPTRKAPAREHLSREGTVSSWAVDVHVFAFEDRTAKTRHRDSGIYLMLAGDLVEGVKGKTKFEAQLCVMKDIQPGTAEIPCVGLLGRGKDAVTFTLFTTEQEFDIALALATAGHLKYFSVSFQAPRYGNGLVSSFGFGSARADGHG